MAGTAAERLLLYCQRELQGDHSLAFAKKFASSTFYVTHAVSGEQRAAELMHSARAPRVLLRGVSSEPCAEQHSSVLQNHPKTFILFAQSSSSSDCWYQETVCAARLVHVAGCMGVRSFASLFCPPQRDRVEISDSDEISATTNPWERIMGAISAGMSFPHISPPLHAISQNG